LGPAAVTILDIVGKSRAISIFLRAEYGWRSALDLNSRKAIPLIVREVARRTANKLFRFELVAELFSGLNP
jgi:hypothetical protein